MRSHRDLGLARRPRPALTGKPPPRPCPLTSASTRAQVSASLRAYGRAELALRRCCAGCRAGGLFRARGYDLVLASAPLASTASSRHARTLRALSGSPSTVLALGHVRLELGAPAGTCGPSPIPAAGPKRPSTRPARPHQNITKKF